MRLMPLCFEESLAILSSSGGPLSRHVPSSQITKGGKACYCPVHLMPDVDTSPKTLYKDPSLQALVDAVSKS